MSREYGIQPWQMRDLSLGEYEQIKRDLDEQRQAAEREAKRGR